MYIVVRTTQASRSKEDRHLGWPGGTRSSGSGAQYGCNRRRTCTQPPGQFAEFRKSSAHDNYFDQVIANYAFRQRVKPGITGCAQVNGFRGETPTVDAMQRRVELDLWYIDNWSFHLDFAIMFRTIIEIVRGHNAY
jgi:Bacterial sugar transferase